MFSQRVWELELMDDPTRPDEEFAEAYRELAVVNRTLGGVRAIEAFLRPEDRLILDVAAGGCDIGEALTDRRVISLDINPRGLQFAQRSLPVLGDAFRLPFRNDSFDVVMASLFFHHLRWEECVAVLKEMWRVARSRVVVNDLHRHPVAYASFWVLSALFSKSVMVKHDGLVSVRRAFHPREFGELAKEAG